MLRHEALPVGVAEAEATVVVIVEDMLGRRIVGDRGEVVVSSEDGYGVFLK
jgi:FKBP-type peptidyl-prolyl cis-trans isomerase 2